MVNERHRGPPAACVSIIAAFCARPTPAGRDNARRRVSYRIYVNSDE